MINTDEDALICDLAETYHIFDYKRLSLKQVATFSVGLKNDSRIKLKIAGLDYSIDTLLQGMMVDSLNFLAWAQTEAAQKNENRPQSVLNALLGKEDNTHVNGFATGEEFEAMRKQILRKDDLWQQN